MKSSVSAWWCIKSWLSSKIGLLQLNWCIILGIQGQQRTHSSVNVLFKKAKARHYLAFIGFFFPPSQPVGNAIYMTGISIIIHPLYEIRLANFIQIRIIEVLKVVSSYKFHEKQLLDRRERSKPRFPILFGLLFGRSACPASWQGIRLDASQAGKTRSVS